MNINEQIVISQGATLKLILPGALVIIGSIFLAVVVSIIAAIPVFYIGIVLFLSIKGVFIDLKHRKVKSYFSFLIARIGVWKSIDNYDRIALSLFQEQNEMNFMGTISNTIRTKTFDVYLINQNSERFDLKEFSDYEEALTMLHTLAKKLNLPADDRYLTLLDDIAYRRSKING